MEQKEPLSQSGPEMLQPIMDILKRLGFAHITGGENVNLFGFDWGLDARDLVYLANQIEKDFGITFDETD